MTSLEANIRVMIENGERESTLRIITKYKWHIVYTLKIITRYKSHLVTLEIQVFVFFLSDRLRQGLL